MMGLLSGLPSLAAALELFPLMLTETNAAPAFAGLPQVVNRHPHLVSNAPPLEGNVT